MLFETDFDRKGGQRCIIGICGLAGCAVPKAVDNLLGRLKALSSAQKVTAVQLFNSDTIATHLHLLVSALCVACLWNLQKYLENHWNGNTALCVSPTPDS
jgi:hypothetical protein